MEIFRGFNNFRKILNSVWISSSKWWRCWGVPRTVPRRSVIPLLYQNLHQRATRQRWECQDHCSINKICDRISSCVLGFFARGFCRKCLHWRGNFWKKFLWDLQEKIPSEHRKHKTKLCAEVPERPLPKDPFFSCWQDPLSTVFVFELWKNWWQDLATAFVIGGLGQHLPSKTPKLANAIPSLECFGLRSFHPSHSADSCPWAYDLRVFEHFSWCSTSFLCFMFCLWLGLFELEYVCVCNLGVVEKDG